ncbi:hypothetical protein [Nesterenkonia sp. PF2B19]|uniref:hypothetical protein n=1 Tax=Nesterenkonia sp. PF2B19 TaxID=1881858 RepID=UPI00087305EB|nr:hypothetical protein [Nesterenkonia sp. PF2B19]OSM43499.1 hypothetical protein BCY76_008245 [Nesterenkonia sp. PF2B19]
MATAAAISTDPRAEWLAEARESIEALAAWSAKYGTTFTADELRLMTGEPDHPNWFGSAFNTARIARIIEPVGFTTSRARSRHGGVIRTWRAAA